jgi:tRNA dimethylallyltransferase
MKGPDAGQEAKPAQGAVLIAGPTASGKSELAIRVAERLGGVVINADSMQVYMLLNVLTARPRPQDMREIPHFLYGHIDPGQAYSVGAWLRDVEGLFESGAIAGRTPVFVGGTGLYFKALTEGLSEMPVVPQDVRDRWRKRLEIEGPARLHAELAARDPEAGGMIRATDPQRIVRALELLEISGETLAELRARRDRPLMDTVRSVRIVLSPEPAILKERIEKRLEAMISSGAEDEVRTLIARRLNPAMPVMKAIGVREICSYISGQVSLEEAMSRVKTATQRYAKRQRTWFRHQFGPEWHVATTPEDAFSLILQLYDELQGRINEP